AISDSEVYVTGFFYKNFGKEILLHTTTQGKSWQQFAINTSDSITSIIYPKSVLFYDSLHGVAFGDASNDCVSIWQTSDGGNTWNKIKCDSIDYPNTKKQFSVGSRNSTS